MMKINATGLVLGLLLAWVPATHAQGPAHLSQVVQQAEPPVTWGAPASIGYGTPLDGTQLDASSSVAGAFSYAPAASAMLAPGQQILTTVFTPADPNYKVATVQVPLTVRPAAGATFDLDAWHAPAGQIVWHPGESITLWLTPTGDFHQPVTLACDVTAGYTCTLDQTTMRPVSVALPLRVTIKRLPGSPSGPEEPRGKLLSGLLLLAFLNRKKLRGVGVMLALLIAIAGCGTAPKATATITASSLLETKSLLIHVVDSY